VARILVVSWNYPPAVGGIESLVHDVSRALAARHEVTVLTRAIAGAPAMPGVERLGAGGLATFLPRAVTAAAAASRRRRADLVVAGSAVVSAASAAAALAGPARAVLVCHGLDLLYPNPLYRAMVRTTIRAHRAVVANSRHTRGLAVGLGADPSRVEVVPPGGSSDTIRRIGAAPPAEETKARLGVPGRPLLLSVGRVIPRKGLHRFVRDALPLVLREVPDALLVIAGDDAAAGLVHREGEVGLIRAAVAELGLGRSVLLAGRVGADELAALYRAADLFVFPGREVRGDVEGFGMVVIEAAAAGATAVVTDCGGIPDTVEDGVTGLVVPPGDPAAFARAVVALLRDPARRQALGRAAAARAAREFTAEALAGRWLGLVDRLLASGA